jgi:transcription factor WhiB
MIDPTIADEHDRWWHQAACAGRNPAWWSSEERPMWPSAVRLCLSCPVRKSCLEEAVEQRDNGVIRGGMLLVDTSRGYAAVPLICANCGLRPVRMTESGGVPRYCGRTCQVTSYQRNARPRPGAARINAGHRWAAGSAVAARRPPAPPRSSPVAR